MLIGVVRVTRDRMRKRSGLIGKRSCLQEAKNNAVELGEIKNSKKKNPVK